MKIKMFAIVLLGSLSWFAAAAGTLEIREAYVREMPPGQSTSAAFMNLTNTSNRPIAIVAATSDGAGQAEIHRHRNQNGMMQMERATRVEIPAHGQLSFAPGGYHLMLINLKRSFRAGDKINITLLDEEGKFYTAAFPVVKMLGADTPSH
jgi:copper(I)-binding protein